MKLIITLTALATLSAATLPSYSVTKDNKTDASLPQYSEVNRGYASFDVSMPIDSTGYTLHGKNLKGGFIKFTDKGQYVTPLLAHETGSFNMPVVTSLKGKPLIKTKIKYNAIKFVNPNGIDNFFIKVGTATRTQTFSGVDPKIVKSGTYTWSVPFFSVGKESDTFDNKSENMQFIQVSSLGGPQSANEMYAEKFYLYLRGHGDKLIVGHPQTTSRSTEVLSKPQTDVYSCYAHGMWGADGAAPFRTLTGKCSGSSTTFPAGPSLDYEYGSFKLPTALSPWTATKKDHCMLQGKRQSGCTSIKIGSDFNYMAQKVRIPIKNNVFVTAESGTLYRNLKTENVRYVCKSNVYLKGILPTKDCLKKSYVPGGWSTPYFAVGFEFKGKDGYRYTARYMYIPVKENANKLTWNDSSDTQIYAISVTKDGDPAAKKPSVTEVRKRFNAALDEIRKVPALYDVLGKTYFVDILKKNKLYDEPSNS